MSSELKNKVKSSGSISEVALFLGKTGVPFNEKIYLCVKKLITSYPKIPLFTLAIVESLIWARYAKDRKHFFDLAINYLIRGDEQIFNKINDFAWRFGPEKLKAVLESWKILINRLEISKILHLFSSKQLFTFQQNALNEAANLYKIKKIPQIGAWIFCGPFKIISAYRKDLWNGLDLDEIWMPLGFQVVRGLRFLKQKGYDIPIELLKEEEPGLLEGMGTVMIAQNLQKHFAKLAKTRLLHINSGLFQLGEEKN
jgi:hypothetical protein